MRVTTLSMLVAALPAIASAAAPTQPTASSEPTSSSTTARSGAPASAQELARTLLSEQQWDRLLDGYASSLSGQVSGSLLGRGEPVPDGLQAKIRKELGERLGYQQTVEVHAQALAHQLTPQELEKTVEFYTSPVGKKVLEKLPDAQAELGEELQTRLASVVPEIVQRLAPKALDPEAAPGSASGRDPPAAQGRTPPPQGKQR